jgi:hypothetical protein
MTVKLNRLGNIFSRKAAGRYLLYALLYAYCFYGIFSESNTSFYVLIPLSAVLLIMEFFFILYFPITSFRVESGSIEYYDKIETSRMGNYRSYEKMGFLVKDVKSIKISRNFFEKLFGFAHIEVDGLAEGASSFDTYRIPKRKYHYFCGVRNADELYDSLCGFFSDGVVEYRC